MKKVLVPTDFSVNSKAGIKVAIHWATKQKLHLVFMNVLYIPRPTSWSDAAFKKFAQQEETACRAKLEKFVGGVYGNMTPGNHSFVIVPGISADTCIMDYCRKNRDIDYICISTRGAGTLNKFLGTNTGNLITRSQVPILAVPKNYKASDINRVLFASDLQNYKHELSKVIEFAEPLKASVEVVHFAWPNEDSLKRRTLAQNSKKQYKFGLTLHFENNDAIHSIVQKLHEEVRIRKPSVVIMFTNQNRTFFERIFLSSKAEEFSFQVKVPLLVFNKQ